MTLFSQSRLLWGALLAPPGVSRCRSCTIIAAGLAAAVIVSTAPVRLWAVELLELVEQPIAEKNATQPGLTIDNFDEWVFNDQKNIRAAKGQLLERLQGEAEAVQSTCRLTDKQKEKLLLAGRGDIQAFLQQYAKLRCWFAENLDDQQAHQKVWHEIAPLQKKYQGKIYGAGSLFTKVLNQLLDEQQSSRVENSPSEQRKFQYQAMVLQFVAQFDQAAPFTDQQRETLLALLDRHTSPPQTIGGGNRTHYLMLYVLGQMAEIPEDQLRPLFGESAWKVLQRQMQQGEAMQRNLQHHGWVPEKD